MPTGFNAMMKLLIQAATGILSTFRITPWLISKCSLPRQRRTFRSAVLVPQIIASQFKEQQEQ
jgi:hypothetical protein